VIKPNVEKSVRASGVFLGPLTFGVLLKRLMLRAEIVQETPEDMTIFSALRSERLVNNYTN